MNSNCRYRFLKLSYDTIMLGFAIETGCKELLPRTAFSWTDLCPSPSSARRRACSVSIRKELDLGIFITLLVLIGHYVVCQTRSIVRIGHQ